MPPLSHVFFTNAYGAGGAGFRTHFEAAPWRSVERERVGRWLQALRLAQGTEGRFGYACDVFRLGGTIHAALARVDGAFAADEHGRRGGVMAHALLLPLSEEEPSGLFGPALWKRLARLERPAVPDRERFDAYLADCRAEPELAVPAWDPEALAGLEEGFLAAVVALAEALPQLPAGMALPVSAEAELPALLLLAACALPLRLRLAFRWMVNLQPGSGLGCVVTGGGAGTGPSPAVAGYLEWLRRVGQGAVGVVESWGVRSWGDLERLSQLDSLPVVAVGLEMTKDSKR